MAGSTFSSRIFVRSKKLRDVLHAFSSARSGSGGISAEDYDWMTTEVEQMPAEAPESALLPFLGAEETCLRMFAFKAQRPLLHILSTSAPVCQLLKPSVFDVVGLITDGHLGAVSVDMLKPLAARCPHLYAFIKQHLGLAEMPQHVTTLLEMLQKVISRVAHLYVCRTWLTCLYRKVQRSSM